MSSQRRQPSNMSARMHVKTKSLTEVGTPCVPMERLAKRRSMVTIWSRVMANLDMLGCPKRRRAADLTFWIVGWLQGFSDPLSR